MASGYSPISDQSRVLTRLSAPFSVAHWAVSRPHKPIVFGVRTDPEPVHALFSWQAERAVVQPNPRAVQLARLSLQIAAAAACPAPGR